MRRRALAHGAGQSFPATLPLIESEPGVIYIDSCLVDPGSVFRCTAQMSGPLDLTGHLVITEHWARPSDVLKL